MHKGYISRGRVIVYTDQGECISRARIVMENKIGRKLKKGECVHHIDHNTLNDNPENLQLFSSSKVHLKDKHPELYRNIADSLYEKRRRTKLDEFKNLTEENNDRFTENSSEPQL